MIYLWKSWSRSKQIQDQSGVHLSVTIRHGCQRQICECHCAHASRITSIDNSANKSSIICLNSLTISITSWSSSSSFRRLNSCIVPLCLGYQIFNRLYPVESNIVRIKVDMLYCFYETVADSRWNPVIYRQLGDQIVWSIDSSATRYSDCIITPSSTPSCMISSLSWLDVGAVMSGTTARGGSNWSAFLDVASQRQHSSYSKSSDMHKGIFNFKLVIVTNQISQQIFKFQKKKDVLKELTNQ